MMNKLISIQNNPFYGVDNIHVNPCHIILNYLDFNSANLIQLQRYQASIPKAESLKL